MSDFKSDFEVIRTLGEPALLEQLAEECAELAQAALKLARLERGENPTPKTFIECLNALIEEMADVKLCISVIETSRALDVCWISAEKEKRWAKRILEARGELPEKKKTRQSEFLKIFPKVGLKEGVIDICPLFLDKTANCIKVNCRVCQKDFWLAEVK